MRIPDWTLPCLFLCSLTLCIVTADETGSFWLSADLLSVEWRKGCLTTAGCANPRFNIIKANVANSERVSISWPVTPDIVQDHSRSFTSHWASGSPRDITLSCEVAGVDPTYGFPRVCDATSSVRIFRKTPNGKVKVRSRRSDVSTLRSESSEGRMVVELKGKCYNATLAVAKHQLRCPWCPEHSDVAVVEQVQYSEADPAPEFLHQFGSRDHFLYMALIFLSAISAILSASFACLLVSYLRQRRNSKVVSNKHRLYHEQPSHTVHPLRDNDSDENRYEVPWEQSPQYSALPYYHLGNRGDLSISSPLDASLIASSMSEHPPFSKSALTTNRRFSPNSSVGERRDDSGLESV